MTELQHNLLLIWVIGMLVCGIAEVLFRTYSSYYDRHSYSIPGSMLAVVVWFVPVAALIVMLLCGVFISVVRLFEIGGDVVKTIFRR